MSKVLPQVALGEVLRKSEESVLIDPNAAYREVTVKLWGKGVVLRREASGSEIAATRRTVVRTGQFILSRIDARNGAFGIVPPALDGAVVSNDFPSFNLNTQRIVPEYLGWLSRSADFVELCKAASEGTTNRVRLKEEKFLTTAIALPSIVEQWRIVSRIEELAVNIEEAQGLRRLAAEEAEALVSASLSVFCRSSVWESTTVERLIGDDGLRNGKSVKPSDDGEGIRCLTLSAMRNGRIDVSNNKPIPLVSSEAKPYLVKKGDVFIVRGNGSKELCGLAGLVPEHCDNVIFPDLFIRVPIPSDKMLPEFFVLAWNSAPTREVIEEKAKTTSGIWKINQGHILSTQLQIPPIAEQHSLVAYLDGLQTKVHSLKYLQSETAAELDAMLPSILDKAFQGVLS